MKLFVFMGVSGSGKSTIQHSLPIPFLTNCTTRKLRDGEINGYHINEVTKEEFERLQQEDYFFETVIYAGNYYGTPNHIIEKLHHGTPYHCTKDVNGALELKNKLNDKVVVVYVKPPSLSELARRMFARGDTAKQVLDRIENMEKTNELDNEKYADYIIVNNNLMEAQIEAHKIVIKELLKSMK